MEERRDKCVDDTQMLADVMVDEASYPRVLLQAKMPVEGLALDSISRVKGQQSEESEQSMVDGKTLVSFIFTRSSLKTARIPTNAWPLSLTRSATFRINSRKVHCPEMANWTSLLQITPLHVDYAIVYYSMYNILVHAILSSARCLSVPSSIDE